MDDKLKKLSDKKRQLDKFQPLPTELTANLDEWYKVELTYTSNAIEGNTLSRQETAMIVEKGITVTGKTIKEHLEAVNHAQAFEYVKTLINKKRQAIKESAILDIHRIILNRIDDTHAGRYRSVPVRIAGSSVVLPNAMKVPELMSDFTNWLHSPNKDHIAKIAADAHYKFVTIHPFVDGNGRVSRLLMNLLLLQQGYPVAIIRKEDRKKYIDSLEKAQTGNNLDDFYGIIYEAIDRSLDVYLQAAKGSSPAFQTISKDWQKLLRVIDLARLTGESTHTIRYWTEMGLLAAKTITKSGYKLYDRSMVDRIKKIRHLQKEERLLLPEIKKRLKD